MSALIGPEKEGRDGTVGVAYHVRRTITGDFRCVVGGGEGVFRGRTVEATGCYADCGCFVLHDSFTLPFPVAFRLWYRRNPASELS